MACVRCVLGILIAPLLVAPAVAWSIADHGWIRVGRTNSSKRWAMLDEYGREMLFRGINIGLMGWRPPNDDRPMDPSLYEGGKCPPNNPRMYKQPPLCGVEAGHGKYNQSTAPDSGNDLAQIRALGFDVVRLGVTWSYIEPILGGGYSEQYLSRIAQIVDWAREQDIRVIIDMHQDFYAYSLANSSSGRPAIGNYVDGAPPWAVLNKSIAGFPEADKWIFNEAHYDWHTVAAFRTFYQNQVPAASTSGMGLQEHYIRAFAAVVARFKDNVAVLGFEILNEPPPSRVNLMTFSDDVLYPFYRRAIQAVTGVRDGMPDCPASAPIGPHCAFPNLGINDTRHIMFFEPMAIRNQLDRSIQISSPFTEYPNIVYTPHTYTYSFTLWHFNNFPAVTSYDQSLQTAWDEATKMRASVLVTEFGSDTDHLFRLGNISARQDTQFTSSTFWTWKESGGGWSMWEGNQGEPGHKLQPGRKVLLSRARPLAVAGLVTKFTYDPDCGELSLTVVEFGWSALEPTPTLVYLPAHINQTEVAVTDAAAIRRIVPAPDGSRTVEVVTKSIAGGVYTITTTSLCRGIQVTLPTLMIV